MKKIYFFVILVLTIHNFAFSQYQNYIPLNERNSRVAHVNSRSSINESEINFWVGSGSNSAIFLVNWCDPEIAFAWGYRWNGNQHYVSDMMDAIAAADSRFNYLASSGMIDDLMYQDLAYQLSLSSSGMYWMYNVNGSIAGTGYTGQLLNDGDIVEWGDDGCADIDYDTWRYSWDIVVTAVSDPAVVNPLPEDATIAADQVNYWIGEGNQKAIFAVNWCDTAIAFAWGYRFNNDSISVATMMNDIENSDPRLEITEGAYGIGDIIFTDQTYHLALSGSWFIYNVNGQTASAGPNEQYIGNGSIVKWGDESCSIMDESYHYVWSTEIKPVSIPPAPIVPYDGVVGTPGCQAISCTDPHILAWATGCEITRGYQDIATHVTIVSYGTEQEAIGAATSIPTNAVSLGDGGSAILTFNQPIHNGEGYDFAVFENSLNNIFLELAFVEVSSDGLHFVRFPAVSNTSAEVQVNTNGSVDATKLYNLAGKYKAGWGTPFDLAELADSNQLDINHITHVKIIDAIGTINPEYATYDSRGNIVNDPYPTDFYSGGFDLSGVAILNGWKPDHIASNHPHQIKIYPNPCTDFVTIENTENEQIILYNNLGQKILERRSIDSQSMINLQDIPDGLYFLQIGTFSHKIIKIKGN